MHGLSSLLTPEINFYYFHLHLLVHFTLSLEVLFVDEMAGDPFYSRPGIVVLLLVHLPKTALCERAGGVRHLGCDNCRSVVTLFVSVCLSHKSFCNQFNDKINHKH